MGRMKEQLEDVIRWTLEEALECPVDDILVADMMKKYVERDYQMRMREADRSLVEGSSLKAEKDEKERER